MAALLLLATACSYAPDESLDSAFNPPIRVFGEGYEHIFERYIDAITVEQVAMNGLKGLSAIEPDLSLDKVGSVVRLRLKDEVIAQKTAPGRLDSEAWATLTTEFIEIAQVRSEALKQASAETLYEVVFDSALDKLDKYSRYATAEEARDNRALREGFDGIGVHIHIDDNKLTRVGKVIPSSPASKAGLKTNDAIVKVDGEPIVGMDLQQVVRRLRGPRGSRVVLTITRDDEPQPLNLPVIRQHIDPDTVTAKVENGIVYIQLSRFSQETASALATTIARAREDHAQGLKGIVLDLRDNPGGLLDQAVAVSDMFLTKGRIVTTRGRHPRSRQQYSADPADLSNGLPLVVLVNGRSASSSEIVAAALQDLGRAVLIGTNSFGKGTVQSVFRLPNDGELTLTWSRFHAPSGYTLHDLGVMPNLCTSAPGSSVDGLLQEVRENHLSTVPTLHAWRSQALPSDERRAQLRSACPGRDPTGSDDPALELAEALLNDADLYAHALGVITMAAHAAGQNGSEGRP